MLTQSPRFRFLEPPLVPPPHPDAEHPLPGAPVAWHRAKVYRLRVLVS